jgi:hypothetical protein
MTARFTATLAGAALAALSLSVHAAKVADEDFGFETTEDLYMVCSTPTTAPEYQVAHFACRAFIEATVQYHDAVSDRERLKRLICYPDTATIGDGRRAFLSWAEANASSEERMEELPVVGLVRALADSYPCR